MFKRLVHFECHTNCTFTDLQQYVTCSKIHIQHMKWKPCKSLRGNARHPLFSSYNRKTENNYVEVKYSSQAETPLKSHSAPSLSLELGHESLGFEIKINSDVKMVCECKKAMINSNYVTAACFITFTWKYKSTFKCLLILWKNRKRISS